MPSISTASTAPSIATQSNATAALRSNRQTTANSAASRSQSGAAQPTRVGGGGERNNQMLERVDQLVARMESVASRITSREVSNTQRTVLVARFNELQRQVNELDGIVVSEGRGDSGQGTLSRAVAAGQDSFNFSVDDERSATTTLKQIRAVRSEIRTQQSSGTESAPSAATPQGGPQADSAATRPTATSGPEQAPTTNAGSDNSAAVNLLA